MLSCWTNDWFLDDILFIEIIIWYDMRRFEQGNLDIVVEWIDQEEIHFNLIILSSQIEEVAAAFYS